MCRREGTGLDATLEPFHLNTAAPLGEISPCSGGCCSSPRGEGSMLSCQSEAKLRSQN